MDKQRENTTETMDQGRKGSPKKRVVILGVTGSIGSQALDVIRRSDHLQLVGASVHSSVDELLPIIEEFDLEEVAVTSDTAAMTFLVPGVRVHCGAAGMEALVRMDSDIVLNSVVGLAGLKATLAALEAGRDVALANKETLVGAGELVMAKVRETGARLLPVDSEHSAIFQSLQGYGNRDIRRVILTASGGPFRGWTRNQLAGVRAADALKHPNWDMGKKVTIDSATLMNKGLEVIEARWLFDLDPEQIIVHVHPESILHSGVEFIDHSVIAQLGNPDMRLPIQYALNYPDRRAPQVEPLDLFQVGQLTFEKPDSETFPCLALAYRALELGGYYPLIINTADEIAVEEFLAGRLSFLEIPQLIEFAMEEFGSTEPITLEGILALDDRIRRELLLRYAGSKAQE